MCARTGLPLAWEVKTAREHETVSVPSLLNTLTARRFAPTTVALDKGYDNGPIYNACADHGADLLRFAFAGWSVSSFTPTL